jgi:hypothetical protein
MRHLDNNIQAEVNKRSEVELTNVAFETRCLQVMKALSADAEAVEEGDATQEARNVRT